MVMRGREMRGWLHVDAAAVATAGKLEPWVARGITYARSLPAKRKGSAAEQLARVGPNPARPRSEQWSPSRPVWAMSTPCSTPHAGEEVVCRAAYKV